VPANGISNIIRQEAAVTSKATVPKFLHKRIARNGVEKIEKENDMNGSIVRYPLENLNRLTLPGSAKEYLNVAGLLVKPGLGFEFGPTEGTFLPRLQDWKKLRVTPPAFQKGFFVIGEIEAEIAKYHYDIDPICIVDESGTIVTLEQDHDFKEIFINSSALKLSAALIGYHLLVENVFYEDDRADLRRIPKELIDRFEVELRDIDAAALEEGSFWANEIDALREGFKQFQVMNKYTFDARGVIRDSEESIRLDEVVISADAPVIRAIGEFLFDVAEQMGVHGSSFGHEHLRDRWKEWYRVYPDIIVVRAEEGS
jgi:hypothetical protein